MTQRVNAIVTSSMGCDHPMTDDKQKRVLGEAPRGTGNGWRRERIVRIMHGSSDVDAVIGGGVETLAESQVAGPI